MKEVGGSGAACGVSSFGFCVWRFVGENVTEYHRGPKPRAKLAFGIGNVGFCAGRHVGKFRGISLVRKGFSLSLQ